MGEGEGDLGDGEGDLGEGDIGVVMVIPPSPYTARNTINTPKYESQYRCTFCLICLSFLSPWSRHLFFTFTAAVFCVHSFL